MSDLRCDILLFLATSSEEEALRSQAGLLGHRVQKVTGPNFKYLKIGTLGTTEVMAVKTQLGPLSFEGSASRAITALRETGATALISVGMAFGVSRSAQQPGSIIISKILIPYDDRKVTTVNGVPRIEYEKIKRYSAKESLVRMMELEAARAEWNERVEFGAILTGGARIHSTPYRDHLVREFSTGEQVIGGEMEGAGLIASCNISDPNWIVVKGISDYADDEGSADVTRYREEACQNAFRFVLQAIRNQNP